MSELVTTEPPEAIFFTGIQTLTRCAIKIFSVGTNGLSISWSFKGVRFLLVLVSSADI
jgi:hypothetical protein